MNQQLYVLCEDQQVSTLCQSLAKQYCYQFQKPAHTEDALTSFSINTPSLIIADRESLNDEDLYTLAKVGISDYCADVLIIGSANHSDITPFVNAGRGFPPTSLQFLPKPLPENSLSLLLQQSSRRCHAISAEQLLTALEQNQLDLHYQPQVCLQTQQVNGAEALLRWDHPEYGLLRADSILQAAQDPELALALNEWVMIHSFTQFSKWSAKKINLSFSINLARAALQHENLARSLFDLCQQYSIPTQKISLEIRAENALDPELHHRFRQLNQFKFNLCVDNLGFQPFALPEFFHLPFSEFKIDRSFILKLDTDPLAEAVVKSIIDIGHNFKRRVSAVGIESASAWQRLTDLNCDTGQGYYLCQPVSVGEFDKWLSFF